MVNSYNGIPWRLKKKKEGTLMCWYGKFAKISC